MPSPLDPEEHPLDPWGHGRHQREEAGRAGGGVGCGIFTIPFVFPILVPVCFPLYPVATAGFGITYLIALQFFPRASFQGGGFNWYVLAPTLLVFWFLMRMDCRLGERRAYWLLRHVYRLFVFACILVYLFTLDAQPDDVVTHFGAFLANITAIGISLAILGLLHYTLTGEGSIKMFWHGTLEFLRLRPKNL